MPRNYNTAVFHILILATIAFATEPNHDVRWYVANSKAKTFTISTAEELVGLAHIVNGTWKGEPKADDFKDKTINLAKDIDLSQYKNWMPIGNNERIGKKDRARFLGNFDGKGYVISNLVINRPDSILQGLFGIIEKGSVKNLGLKDVNITGRNMIGSIAGFIDKSNISNCYSIGVVNGYKNIGGLLGIIWTSNINNSYSAVTVNGYEYIGGVAGLADHKTKINNCYSTGSVNGKSEVGGMTGMLDEASVISNCYSVGIISGNINVGGITGWIARRSSVINSAALNPEVKGDEGDVGRVIGAIFNFGGGPIANNIAYAEMKNADGNTVWTNKGSNRPNGADVTLAKIKADPTLEGRFKSKIKIPAHLNGLAYRMEISPAAAAVRNGTEKQFSTIIFGNSTDKTIKWSISGNSSASTTINAEGLLSVAQSETATSFIVTATLAENTDISTTAVITVADTRWYTANPNATQFTISTAEELAGLANIVNGTWGETPKNDNFANKTILLSKDINLSKYYNWVPIGNIKNKFSGTFDGGRHVISNLTINRIYENYQGLFGYIENGNVKNLGLENVNINAYGHVGGVVGTLDEKGRVSNCHSSGIVKGTSSIGGIAGSINKGSQVSNSYSSATVRGIKGEWRESLGIHRITFLFRNSEFIGGVVGYIAKESSLSNCYSTGAISGYEQTGGVAGYSEGKISDCVALNSEVKAETRNGNRIETEGRVVGESKGALSNNAGIIYAKNSHENTKKNTEWHNNNPDKRDGEDISATDIMADGTMGNRFTRSNGWKIENERIPGFGTTFSIEKSFSIVWKPESRWYVANPNAKTFTISTADELEVLAHIVNGTLKEIPMDNFSKKNITLVKNIDLSKYKNWVPIGDCTSEVHKARYSFYGTFNGTFNGGGYVISNLTINNHDRNVQGLFGCVRDGKVENLGLENVNILGKMAVGGVAGEISSGSYIFNSYSTGMIKGKALVGGIAGEVAYKSVVTDSYSTSAVNCDVACGGVAGSLNWNSIVNKSYSTGAISGKLFVGGVAGEVAQFGFITESYSTSAVSGDEIVGGIAGGTDIYSGVNNCSAQNSEVKGNKNVGSVTGLKAK